MKKVWETDLKEDGTVMFGSKEKLFITVIRYSRGRIYTYTKIIEKTVGTESVKMQFKIIETKV